MVSRAVKLCGTESVDAPMQALRAGALSAEFDNGALRYIRIGSTEVIRAIAFLVRDENWGTFTPAVEDLKIDQTAPRSRELVGCGHREIIYRSQRSRGDRG